MNHSAPILRSVARTSVSVAACAVCVAPLACSSPSGPPPEQTETRGSWLTDAEDIVPGNKLLGYAAFVEATTPAGVTMNCSGALVTPEYVLTAAHCTVCTTSARVRFVGNPGVWYEAVPGGIHTNPAAFSHTDLGPVDCDQTDPAAYAAQVNQRTVFGSDVALIRIPPVDISDVADAHLMLSPPRGFSPVQWSVGRSAMLLGRGPSVEGGNDFGTMRRGWTSIDRFMPHPRDRDWGGEIVYVMSALRGLPGGQVESFSTGGDSGGPVVAAVDGTDRIIGVISSGDPFGTTAAVTFAVPNATFLRGVLYGDPIPPADVDGDQVPDAFDNCPRDANRGQLDLDEDGWGDVCDNCPPTDEIVTPGWPLGAHLPLSPEVMARAYKPDQANCNHDAELTQMFRTVPGVFDGAGELIGTSDEEYRAATAGTPTLPPEHPVYAIRRIRRGDTCDPIPCGRSALSHRPMDIALIDPAQRTCLDLMSGPKECEITVPASIDIAPIRDNEPGAEPQPGKVGVRYCTCDLAHATPAQRRECARPDRGDCGINPNRYALDDLAWLTLTLNGQDPSTDVVASTEFRRTSEASSSVELAWDSLSDLERLTGVPLPAPPWHITEDGQIEGGPRLQGILWTRTTEYQGSDLASLPDDAWDRSYAELASSYRAADHRIGRETGGGGLPQYTDTCFPTCPPWQAMPWEFCTMCGFGVEMPWLWAVDDVVLAVTPALHAHGPPPSQRAGSPARFLEAGSRSVVRRRASRQRTGRPVPRPDGWSLPPALRIAGQLPPCAASWERMAMSVRALIRGTRLALAASVAAAAACCSTPDSGGTPSPQADGGHDEAASDALDVLEAEAAEDVADVEYVDAEAPDGWHRWPYTPGNCPIFVPDDLASIEPLQWEPCPFQPEGCTRAVATWMAETGGFGFGTGLQAMKTHEGLAFKYVRILPDYWSEVVVLIDEKPVAAWRDRGGQGTCGGSPTLQWGNRASFPIIRYNAVTSPWVLLSDSVKDLMAPSRTEKFGPPDATIASTSGRAFWSDDLLVVWEETSSFAVRDLHTGATLRPRPAEVASQAHAIPFGDQVLWWTRDKGHGSIWLYSHGIDNVPLLRDDAISYDSIVSDGEVIVWTQSTGALGQDEYEHIEIWTSAIGAPVQLEPRMVVDGLSGIVPLLSVGEGWVALNRDGTMRLYRLSDGQRRSLPVVDKLVWSNGQFAIQVADGAVWVITRQLPSNTVPYITRFEIESLPTP